MARQATSTPDQLRNLSRLVREVACGNAQAFAELHALTCRKLRRTAASVCQSSSDVEDVLQDSYLKIWRAASSFDGSRGSPISWMCTIVRNTALDSSRARKLALADLEDAMTVPAPGDDVDEFDYDFARQLTVAAMSRLPEDRRRLLSLAYFEGMSRLSLAQQFGVPVGTVKTWLRRALEGVQADCVAATRVSPLLPAASG